MVDCHYEDYLNLFLDDITDAVTFYASSVKGIKASDVPTRVERALAFLKGEDTPDWHQLSELNHDQFMSAAESAKASKAELATQRAVLTDGMSAAARAAHSTLLRDLGQQAQQEQTVKRDMDIAQAPIYLSLMPACSQIRSPEMVAAIGDKAVRTMYLILSQHAPLPAHLAPTFDASLGRMSFSGSCTPLIMHHKVIQVFSARNVLFPTTEPIAEAERNRIFCVVLMNSHNPAGKAFTDMELARSLNGSKSLRLLSALETATLIHEHLISFPAPVPSKPKGGAGIVGSPQGAPPALPGSGGLSSGRGRRGSGGQGGGRRGAPTVPVAAPVPVAAQAPAPPPASGGAAPTMYKGKHVVMHPKCFLTSFCRKCDVFGHHVIHCGAAERADMPVGGFVKASRPTPLLPRIRADPVPLLRRVPQPLRHPGRWHGRPGLA